MSAPRLSICMASYNGERFLRRQLDSIAAQSRLPDELVVCDDCSSDQTPDIVRHFAAEAPFPVRLHINEKNLGIRGNFQRAIELANGDILLLSDQDDVWHRDKLQRVEQVFAQSPDTALVFHDVNVVDEDLRPLGYTFWKRLGFRPRDQRRFFAGRGFDVLLQHCFVAGATQAFRASLRPLILPLSDAWLYDAWIALVIACVGPVRIICQPLADYRQHQQQAMGGRRKGLWRTWRDARCNVNADYFRQLALQYADLRNRLQQRRSGFSLDPRILPMIDAKEKLCLTRATMRCRPLMRYPLLLRELLCGRYHRYAHGWKTVALDLAV